jgi:hypothetical protein
MNGTSERGRRSPDASALVKLSRMLQSMSRRFPRSYLIGTQDAFGVRLEDGTSLHIVCNGRWSDQDIRDFLALFATWLVADPQRLREPGIPLAGVSSMVSAESQP